MRFNKAIQITLLSALMTVSFTADSRSYSDGLKAYEAKNCKMAFRHWYVLSRLGDKSGAYGVGRLYREGCAVQQDIEKAVEFFNQSKTSKSLTALGEIHEFGEGREPDPLMALSLYKNAYKKGDRSAAISIYRILREQEQKNDQYIVWQKRARMMKGANALCDWANQRLDSDESGAVATKPAIKDALLACPKPERLAQAHLTLSVVFEEQKDYIG